MPRHPIYCVLTGRTRILEGWWGRPVIEVQEALSGKWRRPTMRELRQIGFEATSSVAREENQRLAERGEPPPPPPGGWVDVDIMEFR